MKRFRRTTALSAVCLVGAALGAAADELGKMTYDHYCASCHGADGRGAGPFMEMMTVEAPDLTQLSATNDGEFPMLEVIHIIDGRTGLRAHGGPMPVFGTAFSAEVENPGPYGAVAVTRGRVLSLAYYLESLQAQ